MKKRKSEEKKMSVGQITRYAESIGFVAWIVLLILTLVFESDRFLYLLIYALHFASAGGAMHFAQSPHYHTGMWFLIVLILIGFVSDATSLAEQIIETHRHGFNAQRVFIIVLWCWAIILDGIYIVWSISSYFFPKTRRKSYYTV